MRVGGAAEWLLEPATPDELRRAVVAAREEGFVPRILGGGANLLVDDGVLPGVVITTDRIKRLFRPEIDGPNSVRDAIEMAPRMAPAPREEGLRFVAWSGVSMPKLVNAAAELGWSGVEGLAGVPGNVGGGVAMNAGGRWGEMWGVVERVLVVDEQGEFQELDRQSCSPRYRNGGLGAKIVVSALLHFDLDDPKSVKERGRDFLLEKNRVQPVTAWSAGCIFKNPDKLASGGRSAGKLVEECGLKGRVVGDAIVSPLHGNFIVNRGRATARDVFELIRIIRAEVADKTGIALELEAKEWRAEKG
ncbi:MAG: FAD-binding protein [Planctomycetes bacterium]|nr:FAD-binding protein [Planctomycetota bacterium]